MIRPNRTSLGLFGLLAAMLYAGLTQNNAPAFLLAFLLMSVSAVSALHAWANLRGLKVDAEPIAPVFEGEVRVVSLLVEARNGRRHFGLSVSASPTTAKPARVPELPPGSSSSSEPAWIAEVPSGGSTRAELLLPAAARGRIETVVLRVESVFPLGFFTVSRRFTLSQRHYVYPRPEGDLPLPEDDLAAIEVPVHLHREGDDFAGTREWQFGESMRHIDWKAVARGQRLMVKQWRGGVSSHFILDADTLQALPVEARLRQLTRWVVLAERRGSGYELRLPGLTIPPGQGDRHFEKCLRALADAPGEAVHFKTTHPA